MAISLVSGGTGTGSVINGASITLTLPTLLQNDVVYVLASQSNGTPSMTTAGYTQIATASSGANVNTFLFRKVMGATPDTSAVVGGVAGPNNGWCAAFLCLRGVDTTTPEDATATTATSNSTNPDPPSITTVTDNAWVIACAASDIDDAAVTAPSGYSNGTAVDANGSTKAVTLALATKAIASHGAENPASWTNWASSHWVTLSAAARPDTSVNVALTGQAATSAKGSLAVATTTTAIAGQAATTSIGALAPSTDKAMTGQAATAALGTAVPTLAMDVAGLGGGAASGVVGVDLAAPAAGIAATGGRGTLTVTTGVIVDLVGLGATTAAGTLGASLDTALAGQPATMSAGVLAVSPTLAGLLANSAKGIVVPSIDVPLVGLQLAATPGVLTPDVYQTHRMMLAFG